MKCMHGKQASKRFPYQCEIQAFCRAETQYSQRKLPPSASIPRRWSSPATISRRFFASSRGMLEGIALNNKKWGQTTFDLVVLDARPSKGAERG